MADLNNGLLAIVALEKTLLEVMGLSWNLKITIHKIGKILHLE